MDGEVQYYFVLLSPGIFGKEENSQKSI